MRKIAFAAVAAAVLLAGCATTGQQVITDINGAIAQVQGYTKTACSFLPTASSVAAILTPLINGTQPTFAVLAQVAGEICNAVASIKTGSARGKMVMVRGVAIHGRFVK